MSNPESNIQHPKSPKKLRLFVTGATGFIGSHFLNAALAAGHDVVALRRSENSKPRVPIQEARESQDAAVSLLNRGNDESLKGALVSTSRPPTQLRWLDKQMPDVTVEDFAGCDVLVHLAAHTPNVPYDTLENCLYWNMMVPIGLFRRAAEAGTTRIVAAGSCFEYGRSGERYEFIPPDAPLEPTQTYPASKAAASVAFYQLAVELSLRLSIHRIFQVFGEGEADSRLWPSLRKAALAGEDLEMTPAEQVRDFVPVDEVAGQLLEACADDVERGVPHIANLGTGTPKSLRAFAEDWWGEWNANGKLIFGVKPYRSGEVMRYVGLCNQNPSHLRSS
jgi:nucleoside-diphosphate-sugar epimerase